MIYDKAIFESMTSSIAEQNPSTLSVSKTIGLIKEEFDSVSTAQKCYDKGFNDPKSKYYGMTVEDIVAAWEEKKASACRYGSMVDDYIGLNLTGSADELELWKLDKDFDNDSRLNGLCKGFDEFYKVLTTNTDYQFVTREEKMYIRSASGNVINGRFDCLFYSPSKDRYMLIDWKTSEAIKKENRFQNLLGPLSSYQECNGNEYTIQLHMYKKALSEVYNLTTPDKIDVFICQFSHEPQIHGRNYTIHNENMPYSSALLDKVIDYAYKKHNLLKAKADSENVTVNLGNNG